MVQRLTGGIITGQLFMADTAICRQKISLGGCSCFSVFFSCDLFFSLFLVFQLLSRQLSPAAVVSLHSDLMSRGVLSSDKLQPRFQYLFTWLVVESKQMLNDCLLLVWGVVVFKGNTKPIRMFNLLKIPILKAIWPRGQKNSVTATHATEQQQFHTIAENAMTLTQEHATD